MGDMTPIRLVRNLAELNQSDAAKVCGMSVDDYRQLERAHLWDIPAALYAAVDWDHVRRVMLANPVRADSYIDVLDCRGMRTAKNVLSVTVPELARIINTPYGTVAAWMRGQQEPLRRSKLAVAGVLRDALIAGSSDVAVPGARSAAWAAWAAQRAEES